MGKSGPVIVFALSEKKRRELEESGSYVKKRIKELRLVYTFFWIFLMIFCMVMVLNSKPACNDFESIGPYETAICEVDEKLRGFESTFKDRGKHYVVYYVVLTEEEAKYLSDVTYRGVNAGVQKMDATLAEAYVGMWTAGAEGVSILSCQKKLVSAIVEAAKTKKAAELQHIVVQTLPSITITMSQSELGDVLYDILPDLKNLSIASGGVYPAA